MESLRLTGFIVSNLDAINLGKRSLGLIDGVMASFAKDIVANSTVLENP
jgi:hypothetical protein